MKELKNEEFKIFSGLQKKENCFDFEGKLINTI